MAVDVFYESLAALDDSRETVSVATALLLRAVNRPENAPPLPGMHIRVVRSRKQGALPSLRLFYWIDDENVYLLSVERYDELR
ncbi:MAG TPA: hypothetical protein VNA69_07480 [Thermoanaerobaculia bacterium]|nr:hypothetical protein [Thermoanaerobaculia bacterium]